MRKNTPRKLLELTAAILLSQSAGIIGSIFTVENVPTWYASLVKPAYNPPAWVFAPVWITLYFFIGIAAYLIWQRRKESATAPAALAVFTFQLVINTMWPVIFFGAHAMFIAFIDVFALLILTAVMIYLFAKTDKRAAIILIPYLLWTAFAAVLNFNIWLLNK